METVRPIIGKFYRHSFFRYTVIGGTTFIMDFGILLFLTHFLQFEPLMAASISYWTSIVFNFFVNRAWTFSANESQIEKHAALYLTLLGINFAFTLGIIAIGTSLGLYVGVSKIIATGFQIIWTYIAYKRYIFK